jgi:maltose O-acetyltransferase
MRIIKSAISQLVNICRIVFENIIRNIPIEVGGSRIRRFYYRFRFLSLGKNLLFSQGIVIHGAPKMKVGSNVVFGENTIIQANGDLTIGNNVLVGPGCFIWTVNHDFTVDNISLQQKYFLKPVIIEDNVWIGANVKIVAGVKIGTRSVVGMGSVVTRDVEPNSLVAGNPAHFIKYLNIKAATK